MGLLCEFDVVNDFGYIDSTEEYNIYPDYSLGCEVFVETFLEVSRQLVPVDTGYLRSTLDASSDDTSCRAETDCEYAQYVEYGTWCCPSQPYFEPAIIAALEAAAPLWDQAVDEAQAEEEMLLEAEEEEQRMAMERGGRGPGPGLGFGRGGGLAGFVGMILAAIVVALIVTFTQAITGHDFRSGSGGLRGGGGHGVPYVPDIIIT